MCYMILAGKKHVKALQFSPVITTIYRETKEAYTSYCQKGARNRKYRCLQAQVLYCLPIP